MAKIVYADITTRTKPPNEPKCRTVLVPKQPSTNNDISTWSFDREGFGSYVFGWHQRSVSSSVDNGITVPAFRSGVAMDQWNTGTTAGFANP